MHLHAIDWIIVGTFLCILFAVALYVSRFNRSVADFLTANRCARRYLLTTASGMSGLGAISMLATYEKFYQAGFGALWWAQMLGPISLMLALSGWIIYRLRATRAMTMAQFFEVRYGRKFRIFAGILGWTAGVFNYGIFPIATARFLVYFIGLPVRLRLYGFEFPTTTLVMLVMLTIAVSLALSGGFISVMVTDFIQGQFVLVTLLGISLYLVFRFSIGELLTALEAAPAGQSMLNPFDQGKLSDFNIWFFAIAAFNQVYNYLAWQGSGGFNFAALTPHEGKMSKILAEWRGHIMFITPILITICAWVLLHAAQPTAASQEANAILNQMSDPHIQKQMTVPIALAYILPAGLLGLFSMVIFMAALSTDGTYLHSWGSILVQDVINPILGRELDPVVHMRLLRFSILGVAVFAFIWGLIFPLEDYIFMYWAMTGAIFLGGAGSVIIGGLYTRFGTTQGAFAALAGGSTVAFTGIALRSFWRHLPGLAGLAPEFPLNGMQISFVAALVSITTYVVVSLLTGKERYDLDRLLHRGVYEIEGEHMRVKTGKKSWMARLGINEEFTRGDKFLFFLNLTYGIIWFSIFLTGTIWNLAHPVSVETWKWWWSIQIVFALVAVAITVPWFVICGTFDLVDLFRRLTRLKRDATDDGFIRSPEAQDSASSTPADKNAAGRVP